MHFIITFYFLASFDSQVSWEVIGGVKSENLEAEAWQASGTLETPGWGQNYPGSFAAWWAESHTYKASLVMEEVLKLMEENDTLVVELTAETWGGEVSVGRGGPTKSHTISKRHILHEEQQTWQGAEQVDLSIPKISYSNVLILSHKQKHMPYTAFPRCA